MSQDDLETGERFKELQEELLQIQKKTFTKWVNSILQDANLEVVDLFHDLSDGVKLLKLLQIISGEKVGTAAARKTRFHNIETVTKCLSFLNSKVRLESIGAEDIVQGNPRLIMGLLWTIIVRFQIQMIGAFSDENAGQTMSSGPRTAKDALLLWCQQKTAGYRGVNIHDFSKSWKDGLAFNALIHSQRPDLVEYNSLDRRNYIQNLENAFTIAEKKLGIPRLLDAEDFDVDRPDEKSILTYLSQYYHIFNQTENSARIVGIVNAESPIRSSSHITAQKNSINEKISQQDQKEKPRLWELNHDSVGKASATSINISTVNGEQFIQERPASILDDKLRKAVINRSTEKLNFKPSTHYQSLPNISSKPLSTQDAWACAYCPSINLSTSKICGACFKSRRVKTTYVGTSGRDMLTSKDKATLRMSTGKLAMDLNQRTDSSNTETMRQRSTTEDWNRNGSISFMSKSDEHLERSVVKSTAGTPPFALNRVNRDSSEESLNYKQKMAEKLDKRLKGALELKVDKLELEIKNMKIQYYKRLEISEARFQELEKQMIKTQEEKLRLQKLVEEMIIGSEVTKKKMLRLEQMLKNIFAPDHS